MNTSGQLYADQSRVRELHLAYHAVLLAETIGKLDDQRSRNFAEVAREFELERRIGFVKARHYRVGA